MTSHAAAAHNAPAAPAAPSFQRLEHRGRGRTLFAITLVNLLLKVATLGLYHFWGKTRVRRYVWSHTRFAGEPFEYTGRGIELLLGYAIAMAVLLPLAGAWQSLPLLTERHTAWLIAGSLAGYPALLFLTGLATFSARRYLLSRTRWRAIRFGLSGSAVRHGLLMLGWSLLALSSGGLLYPAMRLRLVRHLVDNAWFGDLRFSCAAPVRPLLRRFLQAGALMTLLIGFWLAAVLLPMLLPGGWGRDLDPMRFAQPAALAMALSSFLLLPGLVLCWLWYRAGELRTLVDHSALGTQGCVATYSSGAFVRLYAVNLLLLAVTLGLAYPWAVVRTARFFCAHLHLRGTLHPDAIGQHPQGVPHTGEGLAEAFDLGSI
jgi:uncharacterized membrane protein YjgN (DUF898 family)